MSHRTKFNPLVYIVPTLLDSMGGACLFTGLNWVSASVYQMFRGFVVVVTAALTVFVLKKKLQAYHFAGIAFLITGVFLVGSATYLTVMQESDKDQTDKDMYKVGLFLLIIA